MTEVTESMIYDMAFRVRLYIASTLADEKRINDLSERETLLLQLIGATGRMSISEISNYYPRVSNSTISTTITKLWKEKKLVDKNILPENQRITTVNLTEKGQKVLEEIKKKQTVVFQLPRQGRSLVGWCEHHDPRGCHDRHGYADRRRRRDRRTR